MPENLDPRRRCDAVFLMPIYQEIIKAGFHGVFQWTFFFLRKPLGRFGWHLHDPNLLGMLLNLSRWPKSCFFWATNDQTSAFHSVSGWQQKNWGEHHLGRWFCQKHLEHIFYFIHGVEVVSPLSGIICEEPRGPYQQGLRNPHKNTKGGQKSLFLYVCIYIYMHIYICIKICIYIYMPYIQHMLYTYIYIFICISIFFSCPLGHWVTGTLCWNEAKHLFSNDSWNQSFLKLGMDHLVPLVNRRTAPKAPVKIPLARPTMMPSSDVVVRETPAQLVLSRLGFNSIPLGAETGTCE